MPEFHFTLASYATFAANGVDPAAVDFVLQLAPTLMKRWLDDRTLQLIGKDPTGDVLSVIAIEGDGAYAHDMIVISASYLETPEIPKGPQP